MFLYNLGIWFFGVAIKLVALFNNKAKLWVRGRRNIFQRLETAIDNESKLAWIHCASLGEFEQGRPIIEAIRKEHPEYKILLTFFSPSGYEVRKDYKEADYVFYLPLDTPKNARKFLAVVKPQIAVFVKYEYWLNYLKQLNQSNCRTFIVSAIFRSDSVFFKSYGGLFRKALTAFETLFVQDKESKELLSQININNVVVAGDTRFDRVASIAGAAKRLEIVECFTKEAATFIVGSSWSPDEELIYQLIADFPEVKFIIAPHETNDERINQILEKSPIDVMRYTKCNESTDFSTSRLLLIDTIGILSSAYQYANYGYIGGGFGVGIHNTLEAATFGLPIAFGPNHDKFKEANDLIKIEVARSISNYDELKEWFSALINDPHFYEITRKNALDYIAKNSGATELIMEHIFSNSKS